MADSVATGETAADPNNSSPELGGFETYSDERFEFSLEYPADVFSNLDRAQNTDGAVWTSSDGEMLGRTKPFASIESRAGRPP